MTDLTISRIATALSRFDGLIDMSDTAGRPAADVQSHFRSRALAALCIMRVALTDQSTAANAITDGYEDGGIDALHLDQSTDTLYLVTTKWSDAGKNPIDLADASKFRDGVRDIVSGRLDRFNEKFRRKEGEIRVALQNPGKIVLITASVAEGELKPHPFRRIQDLLDELNDVNPTARYEHYDRAGIFRLVVAETEPARVSLNIELQNWNKIDTPYRAFYGRTHVAYVAQWWAEYGKALTSRNLRHLLPRSDVNDSLHRTILEAPQHFWYFNNGITIICEKATPTLGSIGNTGQALGHFLCEGVSVVNGAQTVGVIGRTLTYAEAVKLKDTWVQVRIISLESAPAEFDKRITVANNTQNRIDRRDFAALDPQQHRIAREFALDRRMYALKSGDEPDPQGDEGCSLVEATQALACANSMALVS